MDHFYIIQNKRKRDVKSKMKKHDLIGKLLLNDIEKDTWEGIKRKISTGNHSY